MSKINEKDFIETYEKAYFKGNSKPDGIPRLNQTSCEIETYIESLLNKPEEYTTQELLEIVSWKAGNLKELGQPIKCSTGYGISINKEQLEKYLASINQKADDIRNKAKNPDNATLLDIYANMLQDVPTNFGCVYILNLLSFISKGEMPIYDQFAHRAVKALFISAYLTKDDPNTDPYKIKPDQIFIGAAPSKTDVKAVIKMYNEYLWLLNAVFGKKNISRSLDRALWVYGHYKNP